MAHTFIMDLEPNGTRLLDYQHGDLAFESIALTERIPGRREGFDSYDH